MAGHNLIRAAIVATALGATCATGASAGVEANADGSLPGLCGLSTQVDSLLGCPQQQPPQQQQQPPQPQQETSSASAPSPRAPTSSAAPQLQPGAPVVRRSTQPQYVPNVLVVRFRSGVSAAAQARLLHRIGARPRTHIQPLHIDVVSVASVARAQAKLDASPLVMHATRDEVLHVFASAPPNDSFFSYEWGFRQAGFTTIWHRASSSRPVIVAVLDTGVDATQPDLAGVVRPQIDLVNGGASTGDDNGHGTAVAGVIAALANNGVGGAGVCSACSILPIKVMGSNGNGDLATVAAGIVKAADMHARVIDLSLGGPQGLDALAQAVAYAIGKGSVVVAAAGNSGLATPFFPANYPGVVSVAGSNQSDRLYPWSEHGTWIAVSAPGCNVAPLLHGGYGQFCGTSSATPLVAGLAGIMVAAHPSATNVRVASAIERTAKRTRAAVRFGRISAATALAAVR
jgi:subtilisin family serine protease